MTARDYVTAVCGFGRCGTSMVMKMLDAGGLPPLDDASRGSYEVSVEQLLTRPPADLLGRAVKLLDHVHWHGDSTLPDAPWRFIWCERNTRQQAASMVKFLAQLAPEVRMVGNQASKFRASFERDQPAAIRGLQDRGPLIRLKFERVLHDPLAAAQRLADFVDVDPYAAANAVHRRPPECAPDLAFEFAAGVLRQEAIA